MNEAIPAPRTDGIADYVQPSNVVQAMDFSRCKFNVYLLFNRYTQGHDHMSDIWGGSCPKSGGTALATLAAPRKPAFGCAGTGRRALCTLAQKTGRLPITN
jgi:hypothetical protein